MNLSVHHVFMCNTAWSGSKSEFREVSKLKNQFIILICLIVGTSTAGALAVAGPVASMTQASVLEHITKDADADATAIILVAGASSAKRAAERAVGGRAVRVVKKGRNFVVTVISGGNAKRCIVDAQSGQVRGCR